jgi:hypothetical protein
MKRFFLTALTVTLILGLSYSLAYSVNTDNKSQNVRANVASAIEITAPGALDMGSLDVGDTESADQGVLVKSNAPYDIQIKADKTTLTEYDIGAGDYVASSPKTLTNALQWKESSAGTYADISTTDATVVSGQLKTGSSGVTTNVRFKQTVVYDDDPLDEDYEYHIVITYTATVGI